MGVLSDRQIEAEVKITPFVREQQSKGTISFGLSSFGYDVRTGYRFKVFSNIWGSVVDPKNFDPKAFVDVDVSPRTDHEWEDAASGAARFRMCKHCHVHSDNPNKDGWVATCVKLGIPNHVLIPPNSFALAETVEHIEVPRDCLGIVLGKSSYARCGIVLNMTPLEPEWRGKVTLEISNTTPLPAKVYAGEGIGQVIFIRSDDQDHHQPHYPKGCQTSYADRKGRYQNQTGLTLPSVGKGE